MKRYTSKEIEWLKDNYSKLSSKECAQILGRTQGAIRCFVNDLGIGNTKDQIQKKQILYNKKSPGEYNVDERLFIENANPTTVYLLGLLWADGYLRITKRFVSYDYGVNLSLQEKDGKYIKKLIDVTGKWSFHIRHVKKYSRKLEYIWYCTNPILGKYLENNDYKIKSGSSPDKILSKIPNELKKYFFLGYLDGDGCIYTDCQTGGKKVVISFTSVYDQDWAFLKKLCKTLGCTYSIRRVIRKKRKSRFSEFHLNGSKNCFRFGRYIYNDHDIGFPRKRNKFLDIKKYINRMISNGRYQWKNIDDIYEECL